MQEIPKEFLSIPKIIDFCDTKLKEDKNKQKMGGKEQDEKIFAFLCYLISIIGVIIVLITRKDRSDFSIYHAKQGLVLFIVAVIVSIARFILAFIPIIGLIIGWTLWILVLVLWVLGMVNSLTDKQIPLPIIGRFAKSFNF